MLPVQSEVRRLLGGDPRRMSLKSHFYVAHPENDAYPCSMRATCSSETTCRYRSNAPMSLPVPTPISAAPEVVPSKQSACASIPSHTASPNIFVVLCCLFDN